MQRSRRTLLHRRALAKAISGRRTLYKVSLSLIVLLWGLVFLISLWFSRGDGYRDRSTDLRGYHKNYQRDTWSKVLQCLNHEGLQVNGKVSKPVLKERFKSFNMMFDEIHKTQSTWVVSDEQLQSELRVSVSAVMIPAYRAFWGRFKQYLDSGRQSDKYIKYQPDDIENLIDELFDGNPTSMMRRR